ncbi:hypothetical protein PIB30_108905, partial [Stylosanthes scabra]|nr:hypothetical protein [Stylosanthes scabra]
RDAVFAPINNDDMLWQEYSGGRPSMSSDGVNGNSIGVHTGHRKARCWFEEKGLKPGRMWGFGLSKVFGLSP